MKIKALRQEKNKRLNTGKLSNGLKKWIHHLTGSSASSDEGETSSDEEEEVSSDEEEEVSSDKVEISSDEVEMRCIEAVQILTLARRVIIANLADENGVQWKSYEQDLPSQNYGRDLQSLCLMVLGETLSGTLAHIMETCQIDIRGWQLNGDGWGPPLWVLKKMRHDGWCPRLQATLKGQLGRNATLLYATLKLCASDSDVSHPKHSNNPHHPGLGCTDEKCQFVEACYMADPKLDLKARYRPLHHDCILGTSCKLLGPDKLDVLSVIEQSSGRGDTFPILRYVGEGSGARVEVNQWPNERPFTTISHVWAHGLGNELTATIWQCQLDHIRQLMKNLYRDENIKFANEPLFWLDTLAIPEKSTSDMEISEIRRKAIDSIYHVFNSADHGIIIDRHLLQHSPYDDPVSIGVRLLSSGWMRRLWTLQEAFVTKHLYLAGREAEIRDIDSLWAQDEDEGRQKNVIRDSVVAAIRHKLSRNLMEAQRQIRREGLISQAEEQSHSRSGRSSDSVRGQDNEEKQRWASLIADTWTSATYRDVGLQENEILAIATLLNVSVPSVDYRPSGTPNQSLDTGSRYRDKLMKKLWKAIKHSKSPWAIPTGMIFTPGDRLTLRGFGWAPRTWMSGQEESYPYPLGASSYSDELVKEGLIVRYPGFRLRATRERYHDLLGINLEEGKFIFPTSAGLTDWYCAKPLDLVESQATNRFVQELLARDYEKGLPQLAIISSRPRPVEFPPEVALLVEIQQQDQQEDHQRRENETTRPKAKSNLLYCKIIRRLQISRFSVLGQQKEDRTLETNVLDTYELFDGAIIGEILNDDQRWCIDGYIEYFDNPKYFLAPETHEPENENVAARKEVDDKSKRLISLAGRALPTAMGAVEPSSSSDSTSMDHPDTRRPGT